MEIIARLRAEREALVARIGQIDNMLRQYDEWGREVERLLSLTASIPQEATEPVTSAAAPHLAPSVGEAPPRDTAPVMTRQRPSSSGKLAKTPMPEFEAAVVEVLRETGKPMDRVALYEALTERGVVIGSGGRDKDLNTLSARVYRMAQDPNNRISGERGQGYRLMPDDQSDDADTEGDEGADDLI